MKKHWAFFISVFVFYAIGIIFSNVFKPIIFKSIIDLFASGLPKDILFDQALRLIYIITRTKTNIVNNHDTSSYIYQS
jgi:uncharacterized protein YqhQ